jgi:glycosyltransferase involved in cell wall biosynthesis
MGRLSGVDYQPPRAPGEVELDIITPTRDRVDEIREQANRIGGQMLPGDRWIVVDDCAGLSPVAGELAACLPDVQQLFVARLSYYRGKQEGTVNRARHLGCSIARPTSWIVEVDDHDFLEPGALEAIRQAICAGAVFCYGDTHQFDHDGASHGIFRKPDYRPYLLRDELCPASGVRAFPEWLYRVVGGYRWYGPRGEVNCNEFPGGDYGLFMRMELWCEGQGFYRVPRVLCRTPMVVGGISTRWAGEQVNMAEKLREAAKRGTLLYLGESE